MAITLNDIRERATITADEASELLAMGRRQTYAAIKDGLIPSLHLSRRVLIPVPALLRMLGEVEQRGD